MPCREFYATVLLYFSHVVNFVVKSDKMANKTAHREDEQAALFRCELNRQRVEEFPLDPTVGVERDTACSVQVHEGADMSVDRLLRGRTI